MPPTIYNSRDTQHKKPFGAVKTGQRVEFTLRVPGDYGCETPCLFLEKDGGETRQVAHTGRRDDGDFSFFTISTVVQEAGLYFYWFDLWKDYRKLYANPDGTAMETTGEGRKYQLTVYKADFTTPEGVHGGVMYQIFPDRFFEGRPDKPMVYNERIYRADKRKEPYYWPDTQENGFLTWDYYGGDLPGIQQKLPYLESLGVTWIYLNPIFEAHANHRYNTADYMNVDPYLGTNEDFTSLCKAAKRRGISIMLDGVFSHIGADSIYFNKEGRYPSVGAWQSKQSPYRAWFRWTPDGDYESWWALKPAPLRQKQPFLPGFYLRRGWCGGHLLQRGASGFRLDVADELPDDFIAEIRTAIKRRGEDKYLIGEVWEDASTKEAYGVRRKYFWGDELDGVMNYPFRTAILRFMGDGDGLQFANDVMAICENYPAPALAAVTNHLSTHDTERALTALAGESIHDRGRDWQAGRRLDHDGYEMGIRRMQIATVLQFMLPGVPCVYYGDEIGMQGYKDPFNRGFFDWHSRETRLVDLVKELARLRRKHPVFKNGRLYVHRAEAGLLVLERRDETGAVAVAVNTGENLQTVTLLGKEVTLGVMDWKIRAGK